VIRPLGAVLALLLVTGCVGRYFGPACCPPAAPICCPPAAPTCPPAYAPHYAPSARPVAVVKDGPPGGKFIRIRIVNNSTKTVQKFVSYEFKFSKSEDCGIASSLALSGPQDRTMGGEIKPNGKRRFDVCPVNLWACGKADSYGLDISFSLDADVLVSKTWYSKDFSGCSYVQMTLTDAAAGGGVDAAFSCSGTEWPLAVGEGEDTDCPE
jgi:hypothetical protein